jgi:hypothetical protein
MADVEVMSLGESGLMIHAIYAYRRVWSMSWIFLCYKSRAQSMSGLSGLKTTYPALGEYYGSSS